MWNNSVKSSGFTLVELMITLAIAGILVAVGIPSFNSAISDSRLTSYANELVAALNLARSEAIKRGQQVVVRKTGAEWENGWQVFADVDRDPVSDANIFNDDGDATLCEPNEDCLLRVYPALLGALTLRSSFTNFIRYTPIGDSNTFGSFVVCDNSDGDNLPDANMSKLITVNIIGRLHMGLDSDNDGIPEQENGTEITSCI